MFNTYAEEFLNPKVCEEGFSYTPANPVMPIPQNSIRCPVIWSSLQD